MKCLTCQIDLAVARAWDSIERQVGHKIWEEFRASVHMQIYIQINILILAEIEEYYEEMLSRN